MSAPPRWQRKERREGGHTKEGENQPNVSPSILERHIQRGVELIPNRNGAVPTKRGFGWVIQVPAKVLNELVRPGSACFAQRWVEDGKFFWVACDLKTAGKSRWLGKGILFFSKGRRGEGLTVVRW